jgi:hypothetical protein
MIERLQWPARYVIAAAALTLGLMAGGAARATTSDLQVTGVYDFQVTGNQVVISVDKITNVTNPPRISGELYLELWAFRLPYQGISQQDYQQDGYRLASYPIGRLSPGYFLFGVNSGPIPYSPPPPGTWYLTSLVVEYDASAINFGGLLPRAYFNYAPPRSPIVVSAPLAAALPQEGFWWDPAVQGVGYSITVRHGVALVVVYAATPGGAPVWYFTSATLTTNGQGKTVYASTLDKYVGGPCLVCADARFPVFGGSDGAFAIVFDSPTAGTVTFPNGQVHHIVPAEF